MGRSLSWFDLFSSAELCLVKYPSSMEESSEEKEELALREISSSSSSFFCFFNLPSASSFSEVGVKSRRESQFRFFDDSVGMSELS